MKRGVLVLFVLLVSLSLVEAKVIIDGDLIVSNNSSKILSEDEWVIKGNIFVMENSTLIIKDAKITIDNKFKDQYQVKVTGHSTLFVEDSTLVDDYDFEAESSLYIEDNSNLIMRFARSDWLVDVHENSQAEVDSSRIKYLVWRGDQASLKVRNSIIEKSTRLILNGKQKETVLLSGLKPGLINDFSFSLKDGGNISLDHVSLKEGWSIGFGEYKPGRIIKTIRIQDSELLEYWPELSGEEVKIGNLAPGKFNYWNTYENMDFSDYQHNNVTLINTTINFWKLVLSANKTKITNSEINCLDAYGKNNKAEFEIENSSINFLQSYGDTKIKFKNSSVMNSLRLVKSGIENCSSELIGEDTELNLELFEIGKCTNLLKGNFKIDHGMDLNWQNSTVERYFPVQLLDKNGDPLKQTKVVLYNDTHTLDEFVTDVNGKVDVKIKFTDTDYEQKFKIKTSLDGKHLDWKINFLSNTPITLSFKEKNICTSIGAWVGKLKRWLFGSKWR